MSEGVMGGGAPCRVKSSVDGCSNIQMGYGTIIVGATVDMCLEKRSLIFYGIFCFVYVKKYLLCLVVN